MVEQDKGEQYTYLMAVSWLLVFAAKTYLSLDGLQDNLGEEDMK